MPSNQALTQEEEKIASRLARLQLVRNEFLLRKFILQARIDLTSTISASILDTEQIDGDSSTLIGNLKVREGNAYVQIANLDLTIDFFKSLSDIALQDLNNRLSS